MNYRAMSGMSTGAVLVTIGAILYFAVTVDVDGFDINVAGAILMAVGFTVALVSLLWGMTEGSRTRTRVVETRHVATPVATQPAVVQHPRTVVVDTREVQDPNVV